MFGNNFRAWKLSTVGDYASFGAYIALGIFIFWLAVRWLNRGRTRDGAIARVTKRLQKYCSPCEVLTCVRLGGRELDAVLIDRAGVVLLAIYEWGLKIYGGPETRTWRREDMRRREEFMNPLLELRGAARDLNLILGDLSIVPLVVFADNYGEPEIVIGRGSCSVTYRDLKKWCKERRKSSERTQDPVKVAATLRNHVECA